MSKRPHTQGPQESEAPKPRKASRMQKKSADGQANGLRLFGRPKEMIHLMAGEKSICAHKDVLVRHSEFFRLSLKSDSEGSHSPFISFDDIEPDSLSYYVEHCYLLHVKTGTPSDHEFPGDTPATWDEKKILRDVKVLRLADRFVNRRLKALMGFEIARTAQTLVPKKAGGGGAGGISVGADKVPGLVHLYDALDSPSFTGEWSSLKKLLVGVFIAGAKDR